MSIMQALAVIGGGAMSGYNRTKREMEDEQRQKADDEWKAKQRAREEQRWKQDDEDRATARAEKGRMAAAAAPVTPQDASVYQPANDDEGNAMPANPTADWRSVDGQVIRDPSKVAPAVEAANMPSAVMRRQSMVTTDPAQAVTLRSNAMTAAASEQAQRQAEAEKVWDQQSVAAMQKGGPQAFAEFLTQSKGDGQGGNVKVQAVMSPDGKTFQLVATLPDGTQRPSPAFANDELGRARAVFAFKQNVSPEKKLAHLEGVAKFDAENKHRADTLAETARHNRATEGIQRMRAVAQPAGQPAARSTGSGTTAGLTMADLKDGHKTIASTLNADYKTQIETSPDDKTSKAIKTTREAEIADVQRLYTGAMTQGIALTPEQAIAAFRAGKRVQVEVPDAAGKVHRVEAMQVGNRIIPFAESPGKFVEATGPARAAAAAPSPAPSAAAPVASSPVAAPAGPMQQSAPRGDAVLARIEDQNRAQIVALNDAVVEARAQLAAVAKSGDPVALNRYAQALQQAITARDSKANELLGNAAPKFLQSLPE